MHDTLAPSTLGPAPTVSRSRLRAALALFLPVIIAANAAFTVVDGTVAGSAWLLRTLLQGLARLGVPVVHVLARAADAVLVRARRHLATNATLVRSAVAAVAGRHTPVRSTQLLSLTCVAGAARTLAWPASALYDIADVLVSTPPTRGWLAHVGVLLSRCLAPASWTGVVPGRAGHWAAARTRLGFIVMLINGSNAVMLNLQGMCGGVLALLFGDAVWLADGFDRHRGYAHYVWEKEGNGELGPGSKLPMTRHLVAIADPIVNRFPEDFVRVMRHDGWWAGLRAYLAQPNDVHRMLVSYWTFTARMMWDVAVFFAVGLLDAPDAQRATLCEMAIATSHLPADEKEPALFEVRKTAPNAIIEFEHYVSLLLPYDGTAADKVYRRTCAGDIVDTRTVVPSIFTLAAIRFAQSTNAEAYSLRTFLWLYRDEARARAVNAQETARKFGPETVARLAVTPMYPLTSEEIAALTAGGPRPDAEVAGILDRELRARGLGAIADRIAQARPSA